MTSEAPAPLDPSACGPGAAERVAGVPGGRAEPKSFFTPPRLALLGLSTFGLVSSASALAHQVTLPDWAWWGVGATSLAALMGASLAMRPPSAVPAPPPQRGTPTPAPLAAPATPTEEPPLPPVAEADVRNDDREAMIYAVSHDLRAPIRVIEGFTRIVREDYGPALDRVGHDHLERVLGAAARMNHMIDALLDLSRLATQPLDVQPVSLSDLARQILGDLHPLSPERKVRLDIQPDIVAQGDPLLLRCLMENLLSNAWKYSAKRDETHITFGTRPGEDGGRIFFVKDNGAGFDMRFAQRLFGAFQRLHSASEYQGTGVGLASTQRIVRRHGGRIWAESAVNEGATFFFTLG